MKSIAFSKIDPKVVFFLLITILLLSSTVQRLFESRFEPLYLSVSKYGSVNVEKLMDIERYSQVMHISSTIVIITRTSLTSGINFKCARHLHFRAIGIVLRDESVWCARVEGGRPYSPFVPLSLFVVVLLTGRRGPIRERTAGSPATDRPVLVDVDNMIKRWRMVKVALHSGAAGGCGLAGYPSSKKFVNCCKFFFIAGRPAVAGSPATGRPVLVGVHEDEPRSAEAQDGNMVGWFIEEKTNLMASFSKTFFLNAAWETLIVALSTITLSKKYDILCLLVPSFYYLANQPPTIPIISASHVSTPLTHFLRFSTKHPLLRAPVSVSSLSSQCVVDSSYHGRPALPFYSSPSNTRAPFILRPAGVLLFPSRLETTSLHYIS
ncbi:hypothetical protein KSP40_PGU002855 [Platanthera guangdongensis]|uniref:Uncharacterized protein n=1 Tax=Platanthera guangdongensis TaxID=2320717 RepID=A0ABR2N0K7_9ASPA